MMQYGTHNLAGGQTRSLRQSNFELLRIVAMILIVAHHFAMHSRFDFSLETITVNRLWIQFIQIGGKIGVDLFVLISGYFLISQKTIKTSKAIRMWGQLFFYSVLVFLVFTTCGIKLFGVGSLIKHIAPVTFSQWWFASAYFVLYLLAPYIIRLLYTFDKRQYIVFLAVLLLLWSVIPSFTGQTLQGNPLLWFVVLYAIAGHIKLYGFKTDLSSGQLIGISCACVIFTFLTAVVFDVLGTKVSFFGKHATFFYDMHRLPILIAALLMFVGFAKLDLRCHKSINLIASTTFGVYLIHDDSYVSSFLWKTVFNGAAYAESRMLIPYSLMVIAVVFIGCSVVELIRQNLIEKHTLALIDRVSAFIDNKIKAPVTDKLIDLFK